MFQIPNMVIGDEVGERVHSAVRECAKTSDELGLGRLDRALEASMEAFVDSDTAFFDPSLLELLYFPEDQVRIQITFVTSLHMATSVFSNFRNTPSTFRSSFPWAFLWSCPSRVSSTTSEKEPRQKWTNKACRKNASPS